MSFASNSSAFGIKSFSSTQSGPSAFGQSNTASQNPLLGQNNTASQNPLFGGASQTSTSSPFGAFDTQSQTQPQNNNQGTSVFGNTFGQNLQQQQNQANPLFGGQQQNQGNSLFGGQPQNQNNPLLGGQQQNQSNPLFGGQQLNQGNTLFGGQPNQSNPLFGGQQQNQSNPLFGGQQQNQGNPPFGGQQQNQSNPLFGGSNPFGQSNTNAQGSGSTLGSSFFATPPNQQGSSPSAFGQLGTNTNNNLSTLGQSPFGSNVNPLQAQSTQSAFGTGSSTLPGGSLFGKEPSQAPLGSLSASNASPPPFTRTTKFNDLPDDFKKVFEAIDSHIQGRVHISDELKQRKLGDEATKGQELIRHVHKDLVDTLSTMRSDVHQTRDLKAKVDQTVQDTIVATRIIDGFRNPQQYGVYLKNYATFPLEFYTRVTQQMQERLNWYKSTIEQVERKLSSAANQSQYTPQAIVSTLEAQHATFISLASKTAAVDAELQKLRTLYTQLWRAKTRSMRDPFNDLDRGSGTDFGLESLNSK